jgi:hypothetical protein
MRRLIVSVTALALAPLIASSPAQAGGRAFFSSRPVFFHQPVFFNRQAFNRPAFSHGRFFLHHPFFVHQVPMGASPIVPPFTSFTSFGPGVSVFNSGVAFPGFFGDTGLVGGGAIDAGTSPGVTLIINPTPPAPPPAPVVYGPPTVEKSQAGVEVVRLMNTTLKTP